MPKEVRESLSQQMLHHRTSEFTEIFDRVLGRLKQVFKTQQPVMMHTSTGSGAMESAVVNCFSAGDEVLCIRSGKFGQRWAEICEVYGLKVHPVDVEWGNSFDVEEIVNILNEKPGICGVLTQFCETSTATLHPVKELAAEIKNRETTLLLVDAITAIGVTPLDMDLWGLDVVIAGSQKAFMMPAGMSFIALSEKAWGHQKYSKLPKYYFDLQSELKANKKGQTFFSSPVSHIRALDAALNYFVDGKLDQQIKHSQAMAICTRKVGEVLGLKIFSHSPSPSVTALEVPEGKNAEDLRKHLDQNFNVTVMGGQDHLKGRIIRLGHLGDISFSDLKFALESLAQSMIDLGWLSGENSLLSVKKTCAEILTGRSSL